MPLRILDVGQCGIDGPRLTKLLENNLKAEVDHAATADEARDKLSAGQYDVALFNRVFNADGDDGVRVIGELVKGGVKTPMMLVSDRGDAQEAAVAAGAKKGFGKAAMHEPATLELIRKAAGGTPN
ncbi:MAG TPA: hypothetical protein VF796_06800 [Humisphaera sp.]